jgi:small redox-active disulfide protein 2
MNIKILGTGCAKCRNLEDKVREVIKQNSIDAEVSKVTDLQDIMRYGVMMTPGLVINEKVVSFGSVPKESQILQWIQEAQ